MGVVDGIDHHFCCRVTEAKLLENIIVPRDVLGSFLLQVSFHTINFGFDSHTKVFSGVNPGQRIPTQLHCRKRTIFQKEGKAFSFALVRIFISTKF